MNTRQFQKNDSVVAKADIRRTGDDFPLFHKGQRYPIIDVPDGQTITVQANGAQVESIRLDDRFDEAFFAIHGNDPSWKQTTSGWVKP
jgi:hypothetical protein